MPLNAMQTPCIRCRLLISQHSSLRLLVFPQRNLQRFNAFITRTDNATSSNSHQTSTSSDGPRRLAVKDCFATKGILTSCGSRMLSNYYPPYTATVVEKLLNAGYTMVGKTNLDEFCMGSSTTKSVFGPVKNPWTLLARPDIDLNTDWFITGGSSGGSAVAVATGVASVALGSDTGGSVRNPAAFCGVAGLKPTYGLLSRHGLIPLVNSLDVPAILARTAQECADALEVMMGKDERDSTSVDHPKTMKSELSNLANVSSSVAGIRIGVPSEYYPPELSEVVWNCWNSVVELLEDAGCSVNVVSLPHTQYSIQCYHVLGECDVASNMARYDGVEFGYRSTEATSTNDLYSKNRAAGFNEVVRRRILVGNFFLLRENLADYFERACKVRRLIAGDFADAFRSVDILVTPTALTEAPLYSQYLSTDGGYTRERLDDFFTQPSNMAGLPAMTVPVCLSPNKLPVGVQLIGDHFQEPLLLRVARFIEKNVQFPFHKLDTVLQEKTKPL